MGIRYYLHEGWLYLSVVLDLYSRKIIALAMSERIMAKLVCDAVTMALGLQQYRKV